MKRALFLYSGLVAGSLCIIGIARAEDPKGEAPGSFSESSIRRRQEDRLFSIFKDEIIRGIKAKSFPDKSNAEASIWWQPDQPNEPGYLSATLFKCLRIEDNPGYCRNNYYGQIKIEQKLFRENQFFIETIYDDGLKDLALVAAGQNGDIPFEKFRSIAAVSKESIKTAFYRTYDAAALEIKREEGKVDLDRFQKILKQQ